MQPLTLVLPSRSRIDNLPRILHRAAECPYIERAIIVHDAPGSPYALADVVQKVNPIPFPVDIFATSVRRYAITRYDFLFSVTTDFVCTCDDDWLVDDWNDLISEHFSRPDPVSGITCYLPPSHWHMRVPKLLPNGVIMHEVLLGWGSVFHKLAPDLAFAHWKYRFGEDNILIRNGDRIFAMLAERSHKCLRARGKRLPLNDELALEHMPDHYSTAEEARTRCHDIIKHNQSNDVQTHAAYQ